MVPSTAPADDADEAVARAFARQFLDGAFDDAAASLSDEGRATVVDSYPDWLREDSTTAADVLEGYWWGLHGQHGEPDGIGAVGAVGAVGRDGTDGTESDAFGVELVFEDGSQTAKLAVADGAVTDFWFDPTYEVPGYVDEAAFVERSLTVDAGDVELDALLAVPDGNGPFPGVVLVHGAGVDDPDGTVGASKLLKDVAWGLASSGIATLRYENRPANHDVPEEEHTLDAVVVDDAVAATVALACADAVNEERVFVAGHSQGGMAAPRIAERHGGLADVADVAGIAGIAGIVVLDGRPDSVLDPDDVDFMRYEFELDGDLEEEQVRQLESTRETIRRIAAGEFEDDEELMGKPGVWHRSLLEYDPAGTAADLDAPVFVLKTGRADEQTQPELAAWLRDEYERWRAVGLPAGSRVEYYDGLDHHFQPGYTPAHPLSLDLGGNVAEDVISDVADWIHDAASR